MLRIFEIKYSFDMSVLRLSAGGVSFQHRSRVAGHGPGTRVVTPSIFGIANTFEGLLGHAIQKETCGFLELSL
jgi:hypothetical protein